MRTMRSNMSDRALGWRERDPEGIKAPGSLCTGPCLPSLSHQTIDASCQPEPDHVFPFGFQIYF